MTRANRFFLWIALVADLILVASMSLPQGRVDGLFRHWGWL